MGRYNFSNRVSKTVFEPSAFNLEEIWLKSMKHVPGIITLLSLCFAALSGCAGPVTTPSQMGAPPQTEPAATTQSPRARALVCSPVPTDHCGSTSVAVDLFFRPGSAALDRAGRAKLDEFIEKFKPIEYVQFAKIVGHTDRTGSAASNQRLSERRAGAVANYLFAQWPEIQQRGKVSGDGASQPVADNNAAEGRAKNRRVEVEIFPGCSAQRLAQMKQREIEHRQCQREWAERN